MDELLYGVTDSLQVELHEVEGKWRGAGVRKMRVGMFEVTADMTICSDLVEEDEYMVTFLAKIVGDVWFYIISKKDDLSLKVFDGSVLNLKAKDAATFNSVNLKWALAKIEPAVRATYKFNGTDWESADVIDMDKNTKVGSI